MKTPVGAPVAHGQNGIITNCGNSCFIHLSICSLKGIILYSGNVLSCCCRMHLRPRDNPVHLCRQIASSNMKCLFFRRNSVDSVMNSYLSGISSRYWYIQN